MSLINALYLGFEKRISACQVVLKTMKANKTEEIIIQKNIKEMKKYRTLKLEKSISVITINIKDLNL